MDSWSSGRVAASLGVTVPTVLRAARRLGIDATHTAGGHHRFDFGEAAALAAALGVAPPVAGLSREELFVLAGLSRSPLGLRSERAVARAGGVSPTTAGRALRRFLTEGLVVRERRRFVEGSVVDGDLWRANVRSRRWAQLAPRLGRVVVPARAPAPPEPFPGRLSHLLWNADIAEVDPATHGSYLAGRLVLSGDPQGVAWASANLDADSLRSAGRLRGVRPDQRALAENLAGVR